MTLNQPRKEWYFDSGASSHMTSYLNTLSHYSPPQFAPPPSIVVGNGSLLPITTTGYTDLVGSLHLNRELVSLHLMKNLFFVRQVTTDNNCSVEFDPFGSFVKDLLYKKPMVRCNSCGHLYPLHFSSP